MQVKITTGPLATESEVFADRAFNTVISDTTARTIASWWHSPAPTSANITRLSHRLEFDTDELRTEIEREISDTGERDALLKWLDSVETRNA